MPLSALLPSDPVDIGPYQLHGRLGSGGMGVVYLAFGPQEEAVALKVLQPVLAQNLEYRRRFVREVSAAGRVSSPYVARLLASQTEGELLWMATEYVEGATLQHAVETNGPLPPGRLRALAVDVAAAVGALHEAGLVHRDLKPANVVLAWSGPKLIDFGIAKPENEIGLTEAGAVVGSPLWLPPEVLDGGPATRASDVWGWALCIAYAGTGRSPFGSGDVAAVAYRIARAEPNLTGLPADVPELRALLLDSLDKDPARRPTAPELVRALAATPESSTHPSARRAGEEAPQTGPAAAEDPTRLARRAGAGDATSAAVGAAPSVTGAAPAEGRGNRRLVVAMTVIAVLLVAIGAVTAALVLGDSGTSAAVRPSVTPTVQPTQAAPIVPAPTATVSASLDAAEKVVEATGYTPYPTNAKTWNPHNTLNVIIAGEADKADGYTNYAFFFAGNTFIGKDASTPSRAISVVDRSIDAITLRYALYEPNDPDCCPTGGHADVTFQWNGYDLVNDQPIPAAGGIGPSR